MRKIFKSFAFLLIANIFTIVAFGQSNTIKGSVIDNSTGDGIPAVSVTVKGSREGTYTDDKGNFSFNTNQSFPLTLVVSSIGYTQQEISL